MVKRLDKLVYPPLEDHVGARLWRLAEQWKRQFDAEMVALGFSYFAEARGTILRYVGPRGVPQSVIVARMGLSKQAVQQLLDGLVEDGVVEREPDPDDKRGKRIVLTQEGLRALHAANKVKRAIHKQFGAKLGAQKFATLLDTLEELANANAAPER